MALETLAGVNKIGGFDVVDMNKLQEKHPEMFRPDNSMIYHLFEEKIRPFNFVYVRHDVNSISFTIQNGAIKENGINGCQVDTMIEAAKLIIEKLNEKFPCRENSLAITHLDEALLWLMKRKMNREARGVEGLNKV